MGQFDYHKELHYSQTRVVCVQICHVFDYHKELHYSQTEGVKVDTTDGLTTIKNYTTLKQHDSPTRFRV